MRIFQNLAQAHSEIERDIYKSPTVKSTRVQQRDGLDLTAHESIGYSYSILPGGIPDNPEDLVRLGAELNIEIFTGITRGQMLDWLFEEEAARFYPEHRIGQKPTELLHPALSSTIEGSYPAYTYTDRLFGAIPQIVATLEKNPDSRRAYWPILWPVDTNRMMQPTRIPCSLGYQAFIRERNGEDELQLVYLMRSSDFENFWLTDVYLASEFQRKIAGWLGIKMGTFTHMITSFHSFNVHGQEIY